VDPFLREALRGVLPPLVVGAVFLTLAWPPWRTRGVRAGARNVLAAPLALSLGYLATHVAIHGSLPPLSLRLDVENTLAWAAVLLAPVGCLVARRRAGWTLLVLAFSLAFPWVLLDFLRTGRWDTMEALVWTGMLGGALALGGGSLERLACEAPGPVLPFGLCLVASLAAVGLTLGGSASLGQLAGALAVVLGCAAVLACRQGGLVLVGGALVLWQLLGGLLLAGVFAADLPWPSALLLAAGGQAAWAGRLAFGTTRRGAGAGLALTVALAAGGLALAWLAAPLGEAF